eukprot:2354556-Amphidinium_carterae.1
MEVRAPLNDRRHDLAVTSGDYEIVRIVPTDIPSRGPKTSRLCLGTIRGVHRGSEGAERDRVHAVPLQHSPTVSQRAAKVVQPAKLSAKHGWYRGPG